MTPTLFRRSAVLLIVGMVLTASFAAAAVSNSQILPYCVGCNSADYKMSEMDCSRAYVVRKVLIDTDVDYRWIPSYMFWDGNPYTRGLTVTSKITRTYRVTFKIYCCERQKYNNHDYDDLPQCGWDYWTEKIKIVSHLK